MRRVLTYISVGLLIGVGFFTYDKWVKHANISPWSFVPANAIGVYESEDILLTQEQLEGTEVWKNLSQIPEVRSIRESILQLDTLVGDGYLRNHFKEQPLLVSIHLTSSQTLGALYITEINNLNQHQFLSEAENHFVQRGFTRRTREYQGFTITDISSAGSSFTFIFYKNYFIGSFTPFLVEDAIRTISQPNVLSFQEEFPELNEMAKLTLDQGNVYLNTGEISSVFQTLTTSTEFTPVASSTFLDIKVMENTIGLNGFTLTGRPQEFLSLFNNNPGSTFDMAEIIPNTTAWLHHFSFSDPKLLGESMIGYLGKVYPNIPLQKKDLIQTVDFDVEQVYQLLDQEVGIATLERRRLDKESKLFILEVRDVNEALPFFNSVGDRIAVQSGDTVYHETFARKEIRQLPVKNFPELLFGPYAAGFDQCFYTSYRNYLVFSNNIFELKSFVNGIENEDTWIKSLRFVGFLEKTNREANFSFFVNVPRGWNQFLPLLKPNWNDFMSSNERAIKGLEFMAVQFSNIDNKYYTNIILYQPEKSPSVLSPKPQAKESVSFPHAITTKPYIVSNHYTQKKETILQDSSHTIHLISEDFEALWSKEIEGQVITDFYQIDFYKNGKLQYAFATEKQVHLIDRNGEYIPGYPAGLHDGSKIGFFTIVDYDKSKNYRFVIANQTNKVFLTDKDLTPLTGWDPQSFTSRVTDFQHVRVNRTDYMIAIEREGKIHFLSRRGTPMKGFPVDVKTRLTDHFVLKPSNAAQNSTVITLTENGELIELNFEGRVIRREQLLKPEQNTQFQLVPEVNEDGFVMVRSTGNKYEVLDEAGTLLFEKNYFGQNINIQYYQLGGGVEWIVFVNPMDNFLYLFDRAGRLVTGAPLRASVPVSVLQYESQFRIFAGSNNELIVLQLSK